MRVRTFSQIMLSKETDSWSKQWHGYIGTTIGGTVSLSVVPLSSQETQYITGLAFSSNLANCSVQLLNGTSFLYCMNLPTADKINEFFVTPLKTSAGTTLNINLSNLLGTAYFNIQGYTVK